MFHVFASQEERRAFGGSAFMEMQFCRLPTGTAIKDIVAVDSIKHWQNDSLYISDENEFYQEYSHIFDCGIYNNLKSGTVDVYGINYYAPPQLDSIVERISGERPRGHELLLEWLNQAKAYNGFYILGI